MQNSDAINSFPAATHVPVRYLEGAFWKVFSMACFACINGVVRYLAGGSGDDGTPHLPVNVIMFFQNVAGTLFLLPWLLKSGVGTLATPHKALHFARIATAVGGVYLWYLTLSFMPIAEGVALSFTGPIFTVIGAWILLREKINGQRLFAIGLCLVGAFFITRPDIPLLGGEHPIGVYAFFPLASAVILALSKLATRKLATLGETPSSLATFLLFFMTPASLVLALFEWVTPSLADVTFLTPFGFSKFFLSILIGYLAFAELSTNVGLWIGALIIGISILLLSYELPSKKC
jgi:drug/metabolite transporter (DMT)-like permease